MLRGVVRGGVAGETDRTAVKKGRQVFNLVAKSRQPADTTSAGTAGASGAAGGVPEPLDLALFPERPAKCSSSRISPRSLKNSGLFRWRGRERFGSMMRSIRPGRGVMITRRSLM